MSEVSIIILTKNGGANLAQCLAMVYAQKYEAKFEVIVIDSGSTIETISTARKYPTKIVSIKPQDFGHGRTRNLGARLASGEYLVFLTQDAVPTTDQWLSTLIGNFADQSVAGVYGRQIPNPDTKPMEYFFLCTNYPSYKMTKQLKESKTDMDAIFFSNVNSAIRKQIWEKYPFDEKIIISEDSEWAKRVLVNGYKIIYDPEAAVYHSHNFSLRAAFRRYFDSGVSFSQFASGEYSTGKVTARGLNYIWQEIKFLSRNGYAKWIPYSMFYDLAKFLGVSLGKREKWLPLFLKKRFSKHTYYWQS